MVRTWPTRSESALRSPLAWMTLAGETPKVSAMLRTVSPGWTRYTRYALLEVRGPSSGAGAAVLLVDCDVVAAALAGVAVGRLTVGGAATTDSVGRAAAGGCCCAAC